MARRPAVPPELTRGPFTVAEAERAGLTRQQLEGRTWRRLGAGLYTWAGLPDSPAVTLAAVSMRLPQGAAFSGRTAAWLHGLDLPPCDPVEVTVPLGGVSTLAGATVRHHTLGEHELVRRLGMPTTSLLRTAVDLGSSLRLVEAVVAVDMALQARRVTLDQLRAHERANRGAKGIAQLRRILGLADPAAESPMETRLRLLLVLSGLPRPESQVSLHDEAGRFLGRADLYYRAQRLGLEYDGGAHRDSLVQDDRRQNRLLSAGYGLLRFTANDVLSSPNAVVAQVRAALSTRIG